MEEEGDSSHGREPPPFVMFVAPPLEHRSDGTHAPRRLIPGSDVKVKRCEHWSEYSKPHLVNHVILEACNYSEITG